jgi:hypothetical protein
MQSHQEEIHADPVEEHDGEAGDPTERGSLEGADYPARLAISFRTCGTSAAGTSIIVDFGFR